MLYPCRIQFPCPLTIFLIAVGGIRIARRKSTSVSQSALLNICYKGYIGRSSPCINYIYTGILIGTLTMELGGKVTIECEKTGYKTDLEFKLKVCSLGFYLSL